MRNPIAKNTLLRCQQGVTLVELIVSMVIISIALGGVLMVMNFTTSHSADPMIQHQAVAIAEAYMEEILLQGYDDPDDGYDGSDRDKFDDVDDYIITDSAIINQNGVAIAVLSSYMVDIDVEEILPTAANALGPNTNKVKSKKITVTVKHSALGGLILTGYRTDY